MNDLKRQHQEQDEVNIKSGVARTTLPVIFQQKI
jgi:hypothetical protein